jgi:DNA-binding NarL/FixJ family response regulator
MIGSMGVSVLVIDDDPAFSAIATVVLREMGAAEVTVASDAASGILAAEADRPDAVLVDVGLPDRNGIELGGELARMPWRPRVVLTSSDASVGALSPAGRGGLPFVPKEQLTSDAMLQLFSRA